MDFNYFAFTSIASIILFLLGSVLLFYKYNFKKTAEFLVVIGLLTQTIFIIILWVHIERPPMRTLGETRMWYTFFISLIGFFTYKRWKYAWFLAYCLSASIVFNVLNLMSPENFDRTLMPALQSVWFVPHVIVYIFAYALMGASTLIAIKGLFDFYINENIENWDKLLKMADNIAYLGFSFLTMGLIFGALWAKEAWGHYWTWDPKETWAFITWLSYLLYIHFRISRPSNATAAFWVLALAFVFLIIAWMGINYLPSAQNSVHIYSGS